MNLTPLRSLVAVAPSGVEITMIKYSEGDRELSFYRGNLTATEDGVFWQAKLKAERPGVDKWSEAIAILVRAGWVLAEARAEEGT